MPKNNRERTRKARALMQERPELNYTQALAEVDAAHAAQAQPIDPVLLAPYPDEDGVVAEELGWRVLPADATPAQKARAEAVWRPVRPDRPCRCSGPCLHGRECGDDEQGDGPCSGLLIHVDRFPGSLFSLVAWNDVYQCDGCGDQFEQAVMLEAIPWGEHPDGNPNATRVYPGVRHPNFRDSAAVEDDDEDNWADEADGTCRGCGAYAFSGLLCDGCRSQGWTDGPQGASEPDPDDPRYLQSIGVCLECGAGESNPYDECICPVDEDDAGPEDSEPAYAEVP